eukprot:scaffold12619_cov133-Skeletonema_menzelii.AAC.1
MTPGPFLTAGAPSEKAPGYQSKIPLADRYFSLDPRCHFSGQMHRYRPGEVVHTGTYHVST